METCNSSTMTDATVVRGASSGHELLHASGIYYIQCHDKTGNLKWKDTAVNTIPDQGRDGMLDTYFAGSSYTAAWFMSLITAGSVISTSTYASPTVTEVTSGIIAGDTRIGMTWSAALTNIVGAVVKSANLTSISIVGTATITGQMVVTGGTGVTSVGDTAASGGILFSAANFTGGSKLIANGDTLNITYSVSV